MILSSNFKWTRTRSQAAVLLSQGYTVSQVAAEVGVSERTLYRWKRDLGFAAEVDRLSLMTDIAARAARLRLAKRMVRHIGLQTKKDLLDWLKYAQSETDGIKLDLAALAAAHPSVAARRPDPGREPGAG